MKSQKQCARLFGLVFLLGALILAILLGVLVGYKALLFGSAPLVFLVTFGLLLLSGNWPRSAQQ